MYSPISCRAIVWNRKIGVALPRQKVVCINIQTSNEYQSLLSSKRTVQKARGPCTWEHVSMFLGRGTPRLHLLIRVWREPACQKLDKKRSILAFGPSKQASSLPVFFRSLYLAIVGNPPPICRSLFRPSAPNPERVWPKLSGTSDPNWRNKPVL